MLTRRSANGPLPDPKKRRTGTATSKGVHGETTEPRGLTSDGEMIITEAPQPDVSMSTSISEGTTVVESQAVADVPHVSSMPTSSAMEADNSSVPHTDPPSSIVTPAVVHDTVVATVEQPAILAADTQSDAGSTIGQALVVLVDEQAPSVTPSIQEPAAAASTAMTPNALAIDQPAGATPALNVAVPVDHQQPNLGEPIQPILANPAVVATTVLPPAAPVAQVTGMPTPVLPVGPVAALGIAVGVVPGIVHAPPHPLAVPGTGTVVNQPVVDGCSDVPLHIQQLMLALSDGSNAEQNMYAVRRVPQSANWGSSTNDRVLFHDSRPLLVRLIGRVGSSWFFAPDGSPRQRVNIGVMPNVDGDREAIERMYGRAEPSATLESVFVYAGSLQTVRKRGMKCASIEPFEHVYDATAGLRDKSEMPRISAVDFAVGDIVSVECHFTRWKKPEDARKRAWTSWNVGFELQSIALLHVGS
ncbi:hypothetical protein VTO73DRAFT_6163 [Trametes versicolor]